ncbi:MAG: nucleotidyltransferase family protein [Candidatus Latescibacterota bacterium]
MNWSPEDSLLLSCIGTSREDRTLPHVEALLSSDLDWEEVLEKACRHRMMSLLYHALKSLDDKGLIPQTVMENLKGAYCTHAVLNMRFARKLKEILTSLGEAGIEAIVLKGVPLAEMVYEDIALRPMGDIDLLVRKKDLESVEARLFGLGFTRFVEDRQGYQSYYRHYFDHDRTIPLHIHWELVRAPNAFDVDVDALFHCAKRRNLSGMEALVLSPEDTLMYLALHLFFTHFFNMGLIGLVDIARLIEKTEMDWERVVADSRKRKVAGCLYVSLYFVKELLHAPIPDATLKQLEPSPFRKRFVLKAATEGKTILHAALKQAPDARSQATLLHLLLAENIGDASRTALRLLFPPREFILDPSISRTGSPNLFLRYAARHKSLLSKYGRSIFRLVSRARSSGGPA